MSDILELYIAKAKRRIIDLYYETCGCCYLSFSGGKDSTVVLALIKLCEMDGKIPKNIIPAVFCNTKIELDATLEFVNWVKENWYSNIEIIETPKTFNQVINEYGKPAISKVKSQELNRTQIARENKVCCNAEKRLLGINGKPYHKIKLANKDLHFLHKDFKIKISNECCNQMKKLPFKKYAEDHYIEGYYTGERMAEGGVRQMMFEKKLANGDANICTRIKGPYTIKSPIVDWTDDIVELFIKKYDVPLSRAYTEYGLTRTGCFLCPFSQSLYENLKNLYINEPNKYKASIYYLQDVYIAQGVKLDFDSEYMREFDLRYSQYEKMRYEMLKNIDLIAVW